MPWQSLRLSTSLSTALPRSHTHKQTYGHVIYHNVQSPAVDPESLSQFPVGKLSSFDCSDRFNIVFIVAMETNDLSGMLMSSLMDQSHFVTYQRT